MEESTNKLSSRKFIVWIVWLVLCLGVGVYTFIIRDSSLLEKCLEYFFAVSMLYLGVNVGQKGIYAIADALKEKYSKEEENE